MSELDALIRKFNKEHGGGEKVIIRGSELKDLHIPRTTTGSLTIDVALGGGWPLNQWNEIVGNESAGKTVLALKSIAANQQRNPDHQTLWIASEDFVPDWAQKLGVDLDRVVVAQIHVMEHAYQLIIDALVEKAVDAVVVDSLPALVPDVEAARDMDDLSPGLGARLTGKWLRKSGKASRRSLVNEDRDCLLILINQWREKIGVSFGDPRTTPGGKAKNFSCFTRVEVSRDEWIENAESIKVGQTMKARAFKNKTAPPNRVATVDFYFDDVEGLQAGSFDTVKEILNLAVYYDIIEKVGNSYFFGGEKLYDGPHPSKAKAAAAMRADLDLQDQISAEVLAIALHHDDV